MRSTRAHGVKLILNTALWLTVLGLIVRASGALKEIVFAATFGVSKDTDALVLATTYSTLLPTILGAAVGTALVAHLANLPEQSRLAPENWLWLAAWIGIMGLVCTAVIYVFAPLCMSLLFGLQGQDLARGVSYSRILAPLGAAMIIASAFDALLNSVKQFYVPAITALAQPVFMMAGIVLFGASIGVASAAWGMVIGAVIEPMILALRVAGQRRILFSSVRSIAAQHSSPTTGADTAAAGMPALWRAIGFLSFAGAVSAASSLVDQMFLSKLETGAITSFNYAFKINSLLIGLFGSAFSIAIYPYLSDLAAARDLRGLRRLCWRLSAVVLPITAAVSLLVYVFSYPIVELLFARGNFTEASAREVSAIQQVFAFQLIFYVAGLMAMRILNASRATHFVLAISCIVAASNLMFDWLFYRSHGAAGIALSSVLTSVVSLVAALYFIRRSFANAPA